jgi:hypothetical protein
MEPDKQKPKPFSQRQSWLLMGTILFVGRGTLAAGIRRLVKAGNPPYLPGCARSVRSFSLACC